MPCLAVLVGLLAVRPPPSAPCPMQHRMEASLRDASWAAAELAARQREQQGGGGGYLSGYLLGGLVPQRLAELWQGGSAGGLGAWAGKADSSGSDDGGGMYR